MAMPKLTLLGYPSFTPSRPLNKQKIPDKALALLAYLAVTGQRHPRDKLAGLLWGNMPNDRARNNLSIVLTKLNKQGGMSQYLNVERSDISIRTDLIDCDAVKFEGLATYVQNQSLANLEIAAELYNERFLADFIPNNDEDGARGFMEWVAKLQPRLEGHALNVFITLIDRCDNANELTKAIGFCQRMLEIDPWQESSHRRLMQLFAENRQRELALAQYKTLQEILRIEWGSEPDPETQKLYDDVLKNRISVRQPKSIRPPLPPDLRNKLPLQPFDEIIGRHKVMNELVALLGVADGNWLVNLNGLGGIGKSSLAYAALRELIRGQLVEEVTWVELDADSAHDDLPSSAELFERIVNQLVGKLQSIEQPAAAHAQRVRQVKAALVTEKHLVVIDNIETFDDDGSLSTELFELANPCRFLLVSRPQLIVEQPIQSIALSPLDRDNMAEFVSKRAGNTGLSDILASSPKAVERLYRLVGGHPQALKLFLKLAAYFSAETILDEFESADFSGIDALYADIYERVWQTQTKDARSVLDAMRLAPVSGITLNLLQAYTGLAQGRLLSATMSLVDAALLVPRSWTGEMYYQIHSLTDSFLQSRDHQQLRSEAAQAWHAEQILAACAYWHGRVGEITPATFEGQHKFLIRLVRAGLLKKETWIAATNLMLDLHFSIPNSRYWREWITLHYQALDREDSAEIYLRYRLFSRLGVYHLQDSEFAKANVANKAALDLSVEMNDLRAEGRQHVHLAASLRASHQLELSLVHGKRGLEIFETLGLPNIFLANAFNGLGNTNIQLGDFDAAIEYLKRATKLEFSDGSASMLMARIHSNIGEVLRRQEKFTEASKTLEIAYKFARQSGGFHDRLLVDLTYCHNYLDQNIVEPIESYFNRDNYDYRDESLTVQSAGLIALSYGRHALSKRKFAEAIQHFNAAIGFWENQGSLFTKGEAFAFLAKAISLLNASDSRIVECKQCARELFAVTAIGDWLTVVEKCYGFIYDGEE